MGLTAAAIPEEQGGLGLSTLELCVVAEEMGRHLAPVPFASSIMYATEALKIAGGEAVQRWLSKLASGEAIACVAFTDSQGSWDAIPQSTVTYQKLTGTKTLIADAAAADIAIVYVRESEDGDTYSWWVVELKRDGVQCHPLQAIDRIRKHASLSIDSAAATRLGDAGQDAEMTERLMDKAAILTAFEQLGGAQSALDMCLQYSQERKAFGSAIGSFQAVKHRLADMNTLIELARGHCYYGASALSTDAQELPQAAAGARLAATDDYNFAAEESIEIHGASASLGNTTQPCIFGARACWR